MDRETAKLRVRTRLQIHECRRCELRNGCLKPVPFSGPSPARLAIIGEAPGAEEDRQNRPFIGASGNLVRGMLSDHRIDPNDAMILNSVSCRPPGNRSPKVGERAAGIWTRSCGSPTRTSCWCWGRRRCRPSARI